MNNRLGRFFFLLSFLLLFILSGCSSISQFTSNGPSSGVTQNDYREGTQGLKFSFSDDSLPSELLENSLLSIGFDIHNVGATTIENGVISLNYDKDLIELYGTNLKTFSLEGRSAISPKGEERSYYFEGRTRYLGTESSERSIPLIASVCYPYESILEDTFCVDRPQLTDSQVGVKVCDYSKELYSGQGGPVVISEVALSVDVDSVTNIAIPILDITLKHLGKGLVLNEGGYASFCSGNSKGKTDLNVVTLNEVRLSDVLFTCGINGEMPAKVTLKKDEVRVRCIANSGFSSYQLPFEAPLRIWATYGYQQTVTNKILIKDYGN